MWLVVATMMVVVWLCDGSGAGGDVDVGGHGVVV